MFWVQIRIPIQIILEEDRATVGHILLIVYKYKQQVNPIKVILATRADRQTNEPKSTP